MVSVVLQHRARTAGPAGQSPRALPVPVADVVADLALHGRDLRSHGGFVRQSRISSTSSSTRTAIAMATPPASRASRRWRHSSRSGRRSLAPTITLYGADDGIGGSPAEATPAERAALPALVAHRLIAGVGHFMPREKPEAVSSALLESALIVPARQSVRRQRCEVFI